MGEDRLTLFLINLASMMEKADEALLPGVYKEIGNNLHISPSELGSLTLFRSIIQASCYPLAVYMSARNNRTHVIALGAFLWAAATFFVGLSSTFTQVRCIFCHLLPKYRNKHLFHLESIHRLQSQGG